MEHAKPRLWRSGGQSSDRLREREDDLKSRLFPRDGDQRGPGDG